MDNDIFLCIVGYYGKFPTMKTGGGLSVDDLIRATELCSQNLGYKEISIRSRHELHIRLIQTLLLVAEHRPNHNFIILEQEQLTGGGIPKMCYAYHEKFLDNNNDVNFTLLQIWFMPIGAELPSYTSFQWAYESPGTPN